MALVLLGPRQVVGDGENVTWGPRTSRVAVWVGGRENEGPQVPSAPYVLLRFPPLDPLSSAVAYGFSFLCDCCSKLM